ncbi:MAG: exopolyphosphatase / guanosine-5-triphosphate,3-diphosphate pyrophosphatase [Solirubrobacteraceae bacterium]|nr:exopolyphosphatase / guanosine-5-triphosphate,3-diphosphate pyrophosphatase [Solirubrobacteraceae bacterium]
MARRSDLRQVRMTAATDKLPPVRCACIDIGSNTTRLLVAEADPHRPGALREVTVVRAFTRLGAGRSPDGAIDPAKIELTAATVAEQAAAARAAGADRLRCVATAAIRAAPNGPELCRAVAAAAGLDVRVLTGEEEAALAFRGAIACAPDPPPDGPVGVVDVGGGSTELVVGTVAGGVSWWVSLPGGSSSATEAAGNGTTLREHVAALFAGVRPPRPQVAYAVGGSATSLARLLGPELTPEVLGRGLALLEATAPAVLAARFDLHAERVRILPAGLVLLDAAARALGAPLRIASGGLREGVVLTELDTVPG